MPRLNLYKKTISRIVLITLLIATPITYGQDDLVESVDTDVVDTEKWHIYKETPDSKPIYIEKSPHPNFGKSDSLDSRNKNIEEIIEITKPEESVDPVDDIKKLTDEEIEQLEKENELDQTKERIFVMPTYDHSCTELLGSSEATFTVCNDEIKSVVIEGIDNSQLANVRSPELPTSIEPAACIEIQVVENTSSFDCSGIYSLVFRTAFMREIGLQQLGYFSVNLSSKIKED